MGLENGLAGGCIRIVGGASAPPALAASSATTDARLGEAGEVVDTVHPPRGTHGEEAERRVRKTYASPTRSPSGVSWSADLGQTAGDLSVHSQ